MPALRVPSLAALLLLAALAGCVAPAAVEEPVAPAADAAALAARLSQRLGDVPILHEALDVETPAGVMAVDLYRPEVPDGEKLAVILVASPYNDPESPLNSGGGGKDPENENWVDLPIYNWLRKEMLPRGYALAQMDVRGTRDSGGCHGIMDPAERRATAAVVDWLGAQEWSNGKVGMIGKSYLGLSQLGAAVENPKHLATIVPISAPTHDYAYHYYNGVPYMGNTLTNAAYMTFSAPPPTDPTLLPRYAERVPCYPEHLAASAYTLGDYSERWKARDYRPLIPQMREDVSVFFIHGHQDWNVKPDHVLDVYNAIPGPKTALLGQWEHDYPNINKWDDETFGEREDWHFALHRWFDHWLKGVDSGLLDDIAACPVQTQGSDATWRCLDAFPPQEGVTELTLHPTEDGALGAEPGSGTASYRDGTRVVFTAEPFTNLTRIAGAPRVDLAVSTTSAFNTYLVAALGVAKDGAVKEFDWGYQSLRHRASLERGEPVTPGTSYAVSFGLYPVDHVFQPGESLVLILRGDTGEGIGIQPNPTPGVQTVDLAATRLTLPLAPATRAFTPLAPAELPAEYVYEEEGEP